MPVGRTGASYDPCHAFSSVLCAMSHSVVQAHISNNFIIIARRYGAYSGFNKVTVWLVFDVIGAACAQPCRHVSTSPA